MGRQGGLGWNLYVDEYDVSGDIGSIASLSTPLSVQDVTAINKYANERIGLLHDASMGYNAFWNKAAGGEHLAHRGLTTGDRIVSLACGTSLGSIAFSHMAKQVNYDPARNQDGSMTEVINTVGNGYGGEWGNLLTAGRRTDTTATNGTGVDLGSTPSSYSFGWSAYLHVFAFTGTSVSLKIQDSADNATFADVTGGSFTTVTAVGKERIQAASATATVRRYVRVISSGTFTSANFSVNFVRNETATPF